MISVSQHSKIDFNSRHSVHASNPPTSTAHNFWTEIPNIDLCYLPITPVDCTPVDGLLTLPSLPSHSPPTIHINHVVTMDHHNTDTWAEDRKAHDTQFDAVVAPSPPGPYRALPIDFFPIDVGRNNSTPMEPWTHGSWNANQHSLAALQEDITFRPRNRTYYGASNLNDLMVQPNITARQCFHEDISEGRRRVGEILVRCGVIDAPEMPRTDSTAKGRDDAYHYHSVDGPMVSSAGMFTGENDGILITALADWTSKWVHKLVVQPYLRGSFRFQYQGKPSSASASISSRIRRVFSEMHNPVQVAVHALWFIGTLTRNGSQDNAPFLSVPIFRYLHHNGTFVAEDFMFRTFVTCAMIGDKTINDVPLSTSIWSHLTRVYQVILNATEKYALSCLEWDVVMTSTQWQEIIIFFRSCIRMGSVFDPFAYDQTSAPGIMARCLDELISLSHIDETTSQQIAPPAMKILSPIQGFTKWVDAAEWCPKDDPVINQKPRTIGVAPGADQNLSSLDVGDTAKDLVNSILGFNGKQPPVIRIARPEGRCHPLKICCQPLLVYDLAT